MAPADQGEAGFVDTRVLAGQHQCRFDIRSPLAAPQTQRGADLAHGGKPADAAGAVRIHRDHAISGLQKGGGIVRLDLAQSATAMKQDRGRDRCLGISGYFDRGVRPDQRDLFSDIAPGRGDAGRLSDGAAAQPGEQKDERGQSAAQDRVCRHEKTLAGSAGQGQ